MLLYFIYILERQRYKTYSNMYVYLSLKHIVEHDKVVLIVKVNKYNDIVKLTEIQDITFKRDQKRVLKYRESKRKQYYNIRENITI